MTKTMELYILLKDKLGEQETKALIEAFDEVTEQAKKEVATKADIAALKSELKSDILLVETRLEAKIKLYFMLLALLFLMTNPKAIELLSKLLGMVK
ncbi:MAG: hypothetical protein HQL01_12910 [Nitrospirae bacterium]|nr:hypothetical protein [Nitrospirota bacterium]